MGPQRFPGPGVTSSAKARRRRNALAHPASISRVHSQSKRRHQRTDTETLDDQLIKVFLLFDADTDTPIRPLSFDLLFSCSTSSTPATATSPGDIPHHQTTTSAGQPCRQSPSSPLHARCYQTQAQDCLETMMDEAKTYVDLQCGDVLIEVMEELFIHLAASFRSQISSSSRSTLPAASSGWCHWKQTENAPTPIPTPTPIFQQLFVVEALWIQYACQDLKYCRIFLEQCENLEFLIISSPQFCEKLLKFNLFAFLRRKALWLKLGLHCASATDRADGSGSGSHGSGSHDFFLLQLLVMSEEKLWTQVFLGMLLTYSSHVLLSSVAYQKI